MAATIFSVINTNDSGAGSLRQAILDANANAGTDTITFDASLSGQTILLTGGQLTISDAISITGLGANLLTISGNSASRIFYVSDNTSTQINVTIGGLTLTNGALSGSNDGAAIWSLENLTISDSILVGNTSADDGGAIRNDGTLLISNSTLADNTSIGTSFTSGGGAIINTIGASTTIENSTLSGNTARNGGAIRNDGILVVSNSTISGNTANLGVGGGIANTVGNATISNSTITNNAAVVGGGGIYNADQTVATTSTVTSTIIASNVNGSDIGGASFTSNGNNLIGNGDGASGFTNGNNGDLVGTGANPIDPVLGGLANNGGLTQTHALLAGSPAINAGSNPSNLTTDQRGSGFLRSQDSGTDIGAFESPEPAAPSNITDFNNDNLPDIVWRNTSKGLTTIWFTDGSQKIGGGLASPTIADPNWVTLGVGDYDKDGQRDDILWRNLANGTNAVWFMDGTNRVGSTTLPPVSNTAWEIQGVGDFDHSGYADDILWRNQSTGQTTIWKMDGTSRTETIELGKLGTAWRAQGVGDFEGDGNIDDIVWRNYRTGQTVIWTTDGGQKTGTITLSDTAPTNWRIEGVSDLDGDGQVDDLLWLNTSNYQAVSWFIDDGVKTGNSTVASAGAGWDAVI